MPARILNGTPIAADIRSAARPRIDAFTKKAGRPPSLAIVLVGDDPASGIYVRNKLRAGQEAGMHVDLRKLDASTSLPELLSLVKALNGDPGCDGILVQSPLPDAMGPDAERQVFDAIDPAKDVDGFHPANAGKLVQNRAHLVPCTPRGVIELLQRSDIPIAGAHAVVIGRSDIVGKPLSLLLLHHNATVTICHSKTRNLAGVAATGDILVAAVGRAALVTPDFVKPGATVVDVGVNRVADRETVERIYPAGSPRRADFETKGALVVGDVHPGVVEVAGALTPVPGGVGPMTIAMLLMNTIAAAEARV
jgi:methylenetetrahydrofolate dehydrogenase (NADP+)/methenyltetrahydrofolate cyclohydrolase